MPPELRSATEPISPHRHEIRVNSEEVRQGPHVVAVPGGAPLCSEANESKQHLGPGPSLELTPRRRLPNGSRFAGASARMSDGP